MRILLAAGASEGIEAARFLKTRGYALTGSVAQESAAAALARLGVEVMVGRRDVHGFLSLLATGEYAAVVDAAHPFAEQLHRTLREASRQAGVPYLRFERESTDLPEDPRLHLVADCEGAARLAVSFGGTIFLATGVRNAAVYKQAADAAKVRLVARVLPTLASIEALLLLGFRPEDVVALKGPFSEEINKALFRHFNARVLVSKESGPRGSTAEKVRAALFLGMEVVLVRRPQLPGTGVAYTLPELHRLLRSVN